MKGIFSVYGLFLTGSLIATSLIEPQEFITLSPFVVETSSYDSQFEGSGLLALGDESPFQVKVSVPEELDWVLGVSLQRRGLHSVEPNIQGMGFDRVVTSLNGIYLPNATPTRTGSPLNSFGSTGQLSLNVIRSLPSVSLGPVPTGSRILFESSDYEHAFLSGQGSIQGNPDGYAGTVTARHRLDRNPVSLGIHYNQQGDYEGGSSSGVVDSDYRAWGAQFNGMLYMGSRHATTFAANYFKQELARNASLPLDTKDTPSYVLTLNHSIDLENGILSLRGGYAQTEPYLSSEDRIVAPAAPLELVEAEGESSSYTFGGDWFKGFNSFDLHTGVDCTLQERSMLRSKHLKSGATLEDLIWPDIEALQAGAFIELEKDSSNRESLHWRVGARIDKISSRAGAVDRPVKGTPGAKGGTIRENFIAFHGDNAASAERHDWTGAANVLVEYTLKEKLILHGGLGYTVASAGLGESYRSFVNALGGGVELGNPTLNREKKAEIHAGLSWRGPKILASATAFYADIDDFVQRVAISETPLIYSFANKDARFYGAHSAVELIFLEHSDESMISMSEDNRVSKLTLPLTISHTRAKDVENGKGLPEVPPLEASAGLKYYRNAHNWFLDSCWITLMCRYVASHDNPQPGTNPVFQDTDSYTLVDFELHAELNGNWTLNLRIANLLDEGAFSYLQPPVATGPIGPSSGSLMGGDRIPLPGRNVQFTLGFSF